MLDISFCLMFLLFLGHSPISFLVDVLQSLQSFPSKSQSFNWNMSRGASKNQFLDEE
jgi:hypothetical protein